MAPFLKGTKADETYFTNFVPGEQLNEIHPSRGERGKEGRVAPSGGWDE